MIIPIYGVAFIFLTQKRENGTAKLEVPFIVLGIFFVSIAALVIVRVTKLLLLVQMRRVLMKGHLDRSHVGKVVPKLVVGAIMVTIGKLVQGSSVTGR